jgi:predicted SnoaL-like aldol condensation-catalyzing enzyme
MAGANRVGNNGFFRFDPDGKIVEHWDSIQEIPKESNNGNTMY